MAPLHCPLRELGNECYDRSYRSQSLTLRVIISRGIGVVLLLGLWTADKDVLDIRLVLLVELGSLWLGVSRAPRLDT